MLKITKNFGGFFWPLDFNVNSFKKDRKAPELPRELEFKGDEDRLLFDSIFQWQYEVD